MNLFEDIHKLWYLGRIWWKWHQNWWWNNEMGVLFWQIVKNHFTRTRKLYRFLSEVLYFTVVSLYTLLNRYIEKISAWAALVHSSMGAAQLVLRVYKIFLDCLWKKGLRFIIWASILLALSAHHPKISCFINIVKYIHYSVYLWEMRVS